ncbi:MAG: hypothetical protein H5T69_12655 [Chloroflexi bacterium]|nr:hypothetical protein [Chloroflexota bacterium]
MERQGKVKGPCTFAALRRLFKGQGGMSFASQLVALAIISVTLSILIATLFTSSAGTLAVRQEVSAQSYARQQMEWIKAAPYQSSYAPIATEGAYSVEVQVDEVEDGLQKIVLQVYSTRQEPPQLLCTLEGYKRRAS